MYFLNGPLIIQEIIVLKAMIGRISRRIINSGNLYIKPNAYIINNEQTSGIVKEINSGQNDVTQLRENIKKEYKTGMFDIAKRDKNTY